MICKNCGEENNERFTFCTGCGASLKSPLPDEQLSPVLTESGESSARQKLEQAKREQAESLVGQTLDGKYRLNSVIGVGGTGAVYNATRLKIEDEVVVKIFNLEGGADFAESADYFRREARIAARFKHPNAVTIYDFDVTENGLCYIVTELAAGQSLRQIINEQGALPPQTVSVIATQVCDPLDEAHRQGTVHGDIKPRNIIVNRAPNGLRVKVLDFGLAKLFSAKASDLKKPVLMTGTMRYMSPEQCLGEDLDGRSDIYSFGIVLYEMLGGGSPFDSPNSVAVAVQHVTKPPAPLRSLNPNVSPEVEAVVMRSLEKQREARQQTAADLARQLHNAVYGASGSLSQTYPSGGFTGNSSPPPANISASGSFAAAKTSTTYSTPVTDRQAAAALPPSPANPRGEAIAPPTFASNLSYRERKENSGKFLSIAGVALLAFLAIAAAALIWRQTRESDERQTSENQNTQVKTDANASDNSASGVNDSGSKLAPKSSGADDEFNRLRARLNAAAAPKDKFTLERDFSSAESRYSDDYRFTYQKAKLEAAKNKSHHEAFDMLFGAGEKAIKADKSADLLNDLQKDKSSVLKRLTDHKEWTVLENALRKNDSKALEVKEH